MTKIFILAISIIGVSGLVSGADSSMEPLRQVLNSKNYWLVNPAISWPYPGGFVVSTSRSTTFVDLPVAHPDAKPITVAFAATKKTNKFSLSAILTGMAALIGGNPGIGLGHSKTTTFQQVVAKGSRIELPQIHALLNNTTIKESLKGWLNTKGQRVFIAGNVLTTTQYSVNVDSSTNIDASFNGSVVSKCSDANAGQDPSSKNGKASSNDTPASTTVDTSKSSTTSSSKATKTVNKSNSTKGASTSSSPPATDATGQPGGELHVCLSSSNAITLKTDVPLVFAIGAYEVVKNNAGGFEAKPILSLSQGDIESTALPALPKLGDGWIHKAWPGN